MIVTPDHIPYVQSVSSQEVPPPYQFPEVRVNAFAWEAKIDRVQEYCDRFFNLGDVKDRRFTYVAAAGFPYAVLMILDYPVMISAEQELPGSLRHRDPLVDRGVVDEERGKRRIPQSLLHLTPFSDRGVVSQREVFVALPVVRVGATPLKLITDSALEFALPFIVVDEPNSAVCGREMLGMEKLRANILLGESTFPDSFQAQVSLPGWESAGATQKMMSFLSVETGPAVPTFRGAPDAQSLWTLFRSRVAEQLIGAAMTGANSIDTLSAGALPTAMQTVQLKQFRDAKEPQNAIYQALVSCRSKYSRVKDFQFYKEEDVTITFHEEGIFGDTLRFIELPPGNPSKDPDKAAKGFSPKAAYRFTADIDFDEMLTLHTFSVDRPGDLPPTKATSDLTAPWLRPWRGFFFGRGRRP
jgi:hypothetical protein